MSAIATFNRLFERADWMSRAACRGLDNATRDRLFFPPQGTSIHSVKRAKKICDGCQVEAECLEFALDGGEKYGLWGGKSERERRLMRGERSRERKAAS